MPGEATVNLFCFVSETGSTLKGKNSKTSKDFPFRIDPFSGVCCVRN